MSEIVKLAGDAARGKNMKTGKGWRLLTPKQDRVFKAALITTFKSPKGERFAIYRISSPGVGFKTSGLKMGLIRFRGRFSYAACVTARRSNAAGLI